MTAIAGDVTFSVGEAAKAVGLSTYTLRWYEQQGLVEPVERDSAGRRRYTERNVQFLRLLTRLRRTGMSVADMRRYAEFVRLGPATFAARHSLLVAHRERVMERIAALRQDMAAVDNKIEMYRESQC